MLVKNKQTLRGDTLIEVMFAIGIFALVAISVSTLMNSMLGKSQSAIEVVMARSEIDAQAEALRFIQNSRNDDAMVAVWTMIDSMALVQERSGEDVSNQFFNENVTSCQNVVSDKAFYIDTFSLGNKIGDPGMNTAGDVAASIFKTNITSASTFPRVLHVSENDILKNFGDNRSAAAEGIWVTVVKDEAEEYYDFYIQTCWNSSGSPVPNTINTIVRLKNPLKVSSCRVIFVDEDHGNGVVREWNSITDSKECGIDYTTPTKLSNVGNFEHVGWDNVSNPPQTVLPGGRFYMPLGGHTEKWVAKWQDNTPTATCSIEFKGQHGATLSPSSTYLFRNLECSSASVTAPAAPAANTNYKFKNWKKGTETKSPGATVQISNLAQNTPVTWNSDWVKRCYIVFKDGSNTVGGPYEINSTTETGNCSGSVTAPSGPSKAGRTFTNWKKSGTSTTVNAGSSVSMNESSAGTTYTYEAQYTENSYSWSTSVHINHDWKASAQNFSGTLTCSHNKDTITNISRSFAGIPTSPTITFSIPGQGNFSYNGQTDPYSASINLDCSGTTVRFTAEGD